MYFFNLGKVLINIIVFVFVCSVEILYNINIAYFFNSFILALFPGTLQRFKGKNALQKSVKTCIPGCTTLFHPTRNQKALLGTDSVIHALNPSHHVLAFLDRKTHLLVGINGNF